MFFEIILCVLNLFYLICSEVNKYCCLTKYLFSNLIEANDILSRKSEIKGYVATAKLDLAVKRCIDFYQDFGIDDDDDAVLLSMRFHEIIKNEKMGMWTEDVVITRKTQIAMSILTMIKDFSNLQPTA